MGYFDGLTNASFKTGAQGTTLFYKWGVLGKAYILPTTDKENEIRKFLKLYYMVSLPLVLFVGAFLNWLLAALLLIPQRTTDWCCRRNYVWCQRSSFYIHVKNKENLTRAI